MSLAPELAIAKALEVALKSIDPGMFTITENEGKQPPAATIAYQEVVFVLASPGDVEKGASSFLQDGYMQVGLHFPGAKGKGDAWTRARALRSLFKVTASFVADGITTNIGRTPQILPGANDDDGRYALTVRVFFIAQLPN